MVRKWSDLWSEWLHSLLLGPMPDENILLDAPSSHGQFDTLARTSGAIFTELLSTDSNGRSRQARLIRNCGVALTFLKSQEVTVAARTRVTVEFGDNGDERSVTLEIASRLGNRLSPDYSLVTCRCDYEL